MKSILSRLVPAFLILLGLFPFIALAEVIWIPYRTNDTVIDCINALAVDGDYIWCGTNRGMIRWDKRNASYVLFKIGVADIISAVAVDQKGNKWFGSLSGTIISFDDSTWKVNDPSTLDVLQTIKNTRNSNNSFSFGKICMIVTHNTEVYFGFTGKFKKYINAQGGITEPWYGEYIVSYDMSSWDINLEYDEVFEVSSFACAIDKETNHLWFGGPYGLINVTQNTLIPAVSGTSISVDTNGGVWYSGYQLVQYYDGKTVTKFGGETHGVTGWFRSGAIDGDNIKWFGSNNGLTRFDGATWSTSTPPGWTTIIDTQNPLRGDIVYALAVDSENNLWAGTTKGLYRIQSQPVSIQEKRDHPSIIALHNVPNPFNATTAVSFTLPAAGRATLAIYSVTGQRIRTLVSGPMAAGTHTASWDGRDDAGQAVSSGVYMARLVSGKSAASRKLLFMK